MKTHICAIHASALLLVLGMLGCGSKVEPPIDAQDTSKCVEELHEMASTRADDISRDARNYAPEMLLVGEHLLKQAAAQSSEEETRATIAEADRYLRNAEAIAKVVASSRELEFPEDRSLGELSVAPWGSLQWRSIGSALGSVDIEADMMVSLRTSTDFSDADFEVLVQLGAGAIQYLAITSEVGEGLQHLPSLVGLRDLSFSEAKVGDGALVHLSDCLAIRHLNLMGRQLLDEDIMRLANLPALEDLAIEGRSITDRSMYLASKLPKLKSLIMRGCNITDVGVEYIARQLNLKNLWLFGPAITDHSVPELVKLQDLDELVLLQTSITQAGIQALRSGLEDCNIDAVA